MGRTMTSMMTRRMRMAMHVHFLVLFWCFLATCSCSLPRSTKDLALPTLPSMSSSCSPCAATSTAMSLNTCCSSSRLRSSSATAPCRSWISATAPITSPRPCSAMARCRNRSPSPDSASASSVASSGCDPVTVKYRRATVSRYSEAMRDLSDEKASIESRSFLRSPATTEVRVRSVEEPGPQPGTERLAALARSSDSSRSLTTFAFLIAAPTSASMRARSARTAAASWSDLPPSLASWRERWIRSRSRSSSLMDSTSSKNLSRLAPAAAPGGADSSTPSPDSMSPPPARFHEVENRLFMADGSWIGLICAGRRPPSRIKIGSWSSLWWPVSWIGRSNILPVLVPAIGHGERGDATNQSSKQMEDAELEESASGWGGMQCDGIARGVREETASVCAQL
uniref:Uncharacterized protein n=1 Tax=Arundo donax TaxID=35708 RepID=A0A0A9D8R5_ARUDO